MSKNSNEIVEIILKKNACFKAENEVSPLNFSRFVDRRTKNTEPAEED